VELSSTLIVGQPEVNLGVGLEFLDDGEQVERRASG